MDDVRALLNQQGAKTALELEQKSQDPSALASLAKTNPFWADVYTGVLNLRKATARALGNDIPVENPELDARMRAAGVDPARYNFTIKGESVEEKGRFAEVAGGLQAGVASIGGSVAGVARAAGNATGIESLEAGGEAAAALFDSAASNPEAAGPTRGEGNWYHTGGSFAAQMTAGVAVGAATGGVGTVAFFGGQGYGSGYNATQSHAAAAGVGAVNALMALPVFNALGKGPVGKFFAERFSKSAATFAKAAAIAPTVEVGKRLAARAATQGTKAALTRGAVDVVTSGAVNVLQGVGSDAIIATANNTEMSYDRWDALRDAVFGSVIQGGSEAIRGLHPSLQKAMRERVKQDFFGAAADTFDTAPRQFDETAWKTLEESSTPGTPRYFITTPEGGETTLLGYGDGMKPSGPLKAGATLHRISGDVKTLLMTSDEGQSLWRQSDGNIATLKKLALERGYLGISHESGATEFFPEAKDKIPIERSYPLDEQAARAVESLGLGDATTGSLVRQDFARQMEDLWGPEDGKHMVFLADRGAQSWGRGYGKDPAAFYNTAEFRTKATEIGAGALTQGRTLGATRGERKTLKFGRLGVEEAQTIAQKATMPSQIAA